MVDVCTGPCESVRSLHDDVEKLKKIIFEGNGDSLVTKVAVLEKSMSNISRLSWAIFATVLGILATLLLKHF